MRESTRNKSVIPVALKCSAAVCVNRQHCKRNENKNENKNENPFENGSEKINHKFRCVAQNRRTISKWTYQKVSSKRPHNRFNRFQNLTLYFVLTTKTPISEARTREYAWNVLFHRFSSLLFSWCIYQMTKTKTKNTTNQMLNRASHTHILVTYLAFA